MWELELVSLFQIYLPALILLAICAFAILHFRKTNNKGYLAIGVGFIILAIGWIVLPIITDYIQIQIMLTYSGWLWLYLSYVFFYIIPASLILLGFIIMYKNTKNAESSPKE